MQIILYIAAIVTAIIVVVQFFKKELSNKRKIQIIVSTAIIAILIVIFNSDTYKHYKNYDEKKFCITSKQFPHILKRGNQFYYKHYLWVQNCYLKNLIIENISIKINSNSPITDYEILLADPKEKPINLSIENYNNLSVKIDNLNKGEIVLINFSSKAWLKEPKRDNIRMLMSANTIFADYELLSRSHKKSVFAGIEGKYPNKVYYKDAVIFEKVIAIDHRKLPNLFSEYQYYQFLFDNGSKLIKVFCDSKKFIHIYYSGEGQLEYKSDEKISKPLDIIRFLVFKNNFILSEATFNKHKVQPD